jgi:hypothetical protein
MRYLSDIALPFILFVGLSPGVFFNTRGEFLRYDVLYAKNAFIHGIVFIIILSSLKFIEEKTSQE